jgi:trimethylamine:corrinoid methyltransferase-like protein
MTCRAFLAPPVSLEQLQSIEEAAIRILETAGLEIANDRLAALLAAVGFRPDAAGRFRIPRSETRRFLDRIRTENGNRFAVEPPPRPAETVTPRLTLDPSWYALHLLEPGTEATVPLTSSSLAGVLHLVEALRDEGVKGSWVGQPDDVPGPLRPVMQYWLAGQCLSDPCLDNLLQSPVSLPFELEMAEALGKPIRTAVALAFSPLRLAGESIDCAVAARDRFTGVYVGSMPSCGSTAPIHLGDAFAMTAAETIGGAILLQAALDLPADFGIYLFPADMRTLMQTFGSPEAYLLQLMSAEVNAFFHGRPWQPGTGDLHISACVPGAQAAAEKAAIFMPSALFGTRHFTGAGVLATDEVFSPEQLLIDLEIRDHAQRLAAGWEAECDPARAVNEILSAHEAGSFAGLESTVVRHRANYWTPSQFFRGSPGRWRTGGDRSAREAARERLGALSRTPAYEAPAERRRALDAILSRAQAAMGLFDPVPNISSLRRRRA